MCGQGAGGSAIVRAEDAGYLLHITGKLIGMQYFVRSRAVSKQAGSAKEFDAFMFALFEAQDDLAENGESHDVYEIVQQTWKLMPMCQTIICLCQVLQDDRSLAAGCGRGIAVDMKPGAGAPPFVWSIE